MRLRNIPEAKGIVEKSPFAVSTPDKLRGKWRSAFRTHAEVMGTIHPDPISEDTPLFVEIGCGKGRFLIETALRHPEKLYIGIERYESVLFRACLRMEGIPYSTPADQIEQAGAGIRPEDLETPLNLLFIRADARILPELFMPGEVNGLFLNFSDPWPKARHSDRRLTSRKFLSLYESVLSEGSILEFKTDNKDLFAFSLEEAEDAENWTLLARTWDLHKDPVLSKDNIFTEYERKFSNLGHPICKLTASYRTPAEKE